MKSSQGEQLKEILLGTGNREIVEKSPNGRFWGIGYDTESAEGNTENRGREQARDRPLMSVREMPRKEAYEYIGKYMQGSPSSTN